MHSYKLSFIIINLVCLFSNCSNIQENQLQLSYSNSCSKGDYFVNNHYLEEVAGCYEYLTKESTKEEIPSITPFLFQNEIVYYIVNYPNNQGWKVFSADQRTPAILAECWSGHLSMDTNYAGILSWMLSVAEDMYAIRHAETSELSFSEDEVAANIRFWTKEPSRSLVPEDDETGHWWGSTTTITEPYDSIPHLTVTQWDQYHPYNQYCPYKTDGTGERTPAGCTVIAGAQMLYYLHEKWGIPQYMYSSASCTGDIGNDNLTLWNATTTVWDDMVTDFYLIAYAQGVRVFPESVMISYLGRLVGTEYGNDGSVAHPSDLAEAFQDTFGIDCDYGTYSENGVKNNLLAGFPLIVEAASQWYPTNWNFTIPAHAFLIDGYKRTRVKTTTHYTFIPNDPDNYDPSSHPSYDVTTYSSPEITSIKMNWGWATQWYIYNGEYNSDYWNDGWYTLTGDWIVEKTDGLHNYQYYRKMISNFSIME